MDLVIHFKRTLTSYPPDQPPAKTPFSRISHFLLTLFDAPVAVTHAKYKFVNEFNHTMIIGQFVRREIESCESQASCH